MDKNKKQRFCSKIILSMYLASIGVLSVEAKTLVPALYYDYITNPKYTAEIPYDDDTIDSYLDRNEYLSDDEKNYIKKHKDMLSENSEYVNVNSLMLVLPKLKIEYGSDRKKYNMDSTVEGIYLFNEKKIVVFDCEGFDDCNKKTLLHELNHAFAFYKINNCVSLNEAVNETMRCEYDETICFRDRYYQIESLVLYSLCEIIDPQLFVEYHFNGDLSNIKSALNEIKNDPETLDKLFKDIDNITNDEIELSNTVNTDKFSKVYAEFLNNNKEIYDILKSYFETKYGYTMEEDPIMNRYLNNGYFIFGEPYLDDSMQCKGYFNDDYIVRNPQPGYYFIGDEIIGYITPNERRLNNGKQKSISQS